MKYAWQTAAVVVGMILGASGVVQAQAGYPQRAVTMVVTFPPGGTIDTDARIVAPYMSELLGQPVIVDNRPGASGNMGAQYAARATPDGYTLLFGGFSPVVINPHTFSNLQYSPIDELVPVAKVTYGSMLLAVNPDVPAKTLAEFRAYAAARPGKLNYASSGIGGITHVGMELFQMRTGLELVHVSYKGSAPALFDLIRGDTQTMINAASDWVPSVKAGKIRALMITGDRRLESLPDVPTAAEAGLPDFNVYYWSGIFAPKATPPAIVEKLNATLEKVLQNPAVRERIQATGNLPGGGSAEEFGRQVRADYKLWGEVVKSRNVKAE